MATNPKYELGTRSGGTWRQWSNASGQDYYENLSTGATQYNIPAGCEDVATDTWAVDSSKSWPQWRNTRTRQIRFTDPSPPAPRTYLDKINVQAHLQLVERAPESQEYLYRRVISAVLSHFFAEDEDFEIFWESRAETEQNESRVVTTVLKNTSRPGGSMYTYDYCLVEAGTSWTEAKDYLSKHCASTENQSRQVFGIVHIGLYIQFFTANRGILTALSGGLHLRDHVDAITDMFGNMKSRPLPLL